MCFFCLFVCFTSKTTLKLTLLEILRQHYGDLYWEHKRHRIPGMTLDYPDAAGMSLNVCESQIAVDRGGTGRCDITPSVKRASVQHLSALCSQHLLSPRIRLRYEKTQFVCETFFRLAG